MNDMRMGFKHTILQRLQSFDLCPLKTMSNAQSPSAVQPAVVTDFSINRILGEANAQNAVASKSALAKKATPAHNPTNAATKCSIASASDILDLSKNSADVTANFQYGSTPLPGSYQALHADFLAAAAAANATKFYAQFFPHMFPAYAVSNLHLAAAATSSAASFSAYQQHHHHQQQQQQLQHKRYFTPYIVNSATTTTPNSNRLSTPAAPRVSAATHHNLGTNCADLPVPRAKNPCTRPNCIDCLDYYKHYPFKSSSLPTPPISATSTLGSNSPNYLRTRSSSELLLNTSSMSFSTVTNVNLNSLKVAKSNTLTKSTTAFAAGTTTSEEISYKCRICDKVFGCSQTLQAHEKTHKSPRYECTDCGKGFSQLRNYKYHLSVHRGTKEFAAECPECGKTFNDKGYLSSHMKIHRNKKEYECPYCPKSFNQRVAFNMHVRIHTGVKPHKCAECGKRFSRKMLLKQHMRTHSGEKPYQCSVCGKSFADRSNMTLHHRLHSGIKPFNCPICPKAFTKKHHLKTHLNYHTGCKPYVCPHPNCNQAFTQSSNMRTHAKKCQYRPLQLPFPVNASATSGLGGGLTEAGPTQTSASIAVAASNNLATASIPSRIPRSATAAATLSAGIRMLTAAQQHQQQQTALPPAQQPLLSTLRPF